MKNYDMKNLRNIAFLGSSGAGKTTLAENLFYAAKTITRIGKVDEGNTTLDFDSEEIARKMSLALSMGNFEWKNITINILDTPGYPDYIGEQISAVQAAETAVVIANAANGYEVGLELAIEQLSQHNIAKALIVNRMDNEHADFDKVIEAIHENAQIQPVPIFLPIGKEGGFEGVIDVIKQKAYYHDDIKDVPATMMDAVESARTLLMEAVAETDEDLLNKFLDTMELSDEELFTGAKNAIASGQIFPAFVCSAGNANGMSAILDAIVEYLPSPYDCKTIPVLQDEKESSLVCAPDGQLLAFVFKTYADPNMGDIAYVRVFSGTLKSGMDVLVAEKDNKDKIGNMYYILGKNRSDAAELKAGEIGALVKLKVARTFTSLVATNSKLAHMPVELPTSVYWQAIRAANQADEDKIGSALSRIMAEDLTIKHTINVETHENILSGMGEQQMALVQKKLKNRYKVEAEFKEPRIPYKETIMGSADESYKHKKQSGGKGQYGDVSFRINPTPRGEGFKFINSVVGGVIPGNFIPAIEKGVVETLDKGIIAGYPVVDVSVDVYFGSYHDVDSSEMAFKIASSMALKNGFKRAKPILLEPIHELKIIIPAEYMGDVMGDISTRRGKILGMEQKGKKQILSAHLPAAELFSYFPVLKSLTQGRGRFDQNFSHYEKVPDEIAMKVMAAFKDTE